MRSELNVDNIRIGQKEYFEKTLLLKINLQMPKIYI